MASDFSEFSISAYHAWMAHSSLPIVEVIAPVADLTGRCTTEMLVMEPRDVQARFLQYVCLSYYFVDEVDASTFGSKMPRVDWDFIGNMLVPYPSTSRQARITAFLDRERGAIQQIKIAHDLDPHIRMITTNIGTMLYWARDYDSAIEQYDQSLVWILISGTPIGCVVWLTSREENSSKQRLTRRRALRNLPGKSPLLAASLARSLALSGEHQVGN